MPRQPRSSSSRLRRAVERTLQYCLGPWPIRPALIAISLAFINQFAIVRIAEATSEPVVQAWREALPITLPQSVLIYLVATAVREVLRRSGRWGGNRAGYLLAVVAISIVYSLVIALVIDRSTDVAGLLAFRNVLAVLIISSVFGIAGERVQTQARVATEALALIQTQREQLLVADEFARREVADYLHDRVQGDLVVLSLQMGSLSRELPPEFGSRLNSILEELESLRMLDIRTASRRLSPDITTVGLASALRSMAAGYASTIAIDVECPRSLNGLDEQVQLAVYRIVEQALLNAALHGKATRGAIRVTEPEQGLIAVAVTNDGRPLPSALEPGTGTAIIEAWVSRYGGNWALTMHERSVMLQAQLHLTAP